MATIYVANQYHSGVFGLIPSETKGLWLAKDRGDLTCDDAEKVFEATLAYTAKHKLKGVCRWSFYVEGENEKLSEGTKLLNVATLVEAKKKGFVATIERQGYGVKLALRDKNSTGGKSKTTRKPAAKSII